jgi:sugar lactone lactonase YvrE
VNINHFLNTIFMKNNFLKTTQSVIFLLFTFSANAQNLLIQSISPTKGAKETVVTLTGKGFSSVISENTVTFNDKPATVLKASVTQLLVKIPPQAGTGKVKVMVKDQTAEGSVFTYIWRTVVYTVAGSTEGFADGNAKNAQFNSPSDVAVDDDGNLYVSDRDNHKIRKITPAGEVSTVAGSTLGDKNGEALSAQFTQPKSLVLDQEKNIFVAEKNRIRKITPDGKVSLYAGHISQSGKKDGNVKEALFSMPVGLAIDVATNSLLIADRGNHRIRKITAYGEVSTLAGSTYGFADGNSSTAQFHYPSDICIGSSDGRIFIADANNDRIRVLMNGQVSTLVGSGRKSFAEGVGAKANIWTPEGIVVFGDNIYVSDNGNYRIRKINSSFQTSTYAGGKAGYKDGDGLLAQFSGMGLRGITADKNGIIYVADSGNHKIRKIVLE